MVDERAFLSAILERPDDDVTKLAYADWLEERDDPRAEYLRLMMEVRRDRPAAPERGQQIPARLRELAAALDTNWLAIVSDPAIEGCGRSAGGGRRLRFDLVCDRSWADMRPGENPDVRHCEACGEDVHFCDNIADARERARGRCIAVDLGVIRREGDLLPRAMFLGRPSKEAVRGTYEVDLDAVSQARLDARKASGKKRTGRR